MPNPDWHGTSAEVHPLTLLLRCEHGALEYSGTFDTDVTEEEFAEQEIKWWTKKGAPHEGHKMKVEKVVRPRRRVMHKQAWSRA